MTDIIAPLATICCDKTLPISSKIKRLQGNVAFSRDTPHIRGSGDTAYYRRFARFHAKATIRQQASKRGGTKGEFRQTKRK
ncbi:MAG TPA: hypothetical protein VNZ48_02915 [Xanthobacteraceae bacterium]|nr:hypothetical protein [Xanthobacteraceae bacterium]